jgi:hypothetical protein
MKKNTIVQNPDRLFVDLTSYILSECSPDEIRIHPQSQRIIALHYPDCGQSRDEWVLVRGRYENLHLSGEGVFVSVAPDKFEYFDCSACRIHLSLVGEFIRGEVIVGPNDIESHQAIRVNRAIAALISNFAEVCTIEELTPRVSYRGDGRFPISAMSGDLTRLFAIPGAAPYYKDFRFADDKIVGHLTDDPNMSWRLGLGIALRMIILSRDDSFEIRFETIRV